MPFSQWWQGFLKSKGMAFAWFVVRRFDEERVPQVAASMTFTTLLALVPVLTVMVVIASAFPVFDQWSGEFVSFINRTIVPQGADMVFDYINAFRDKATKLTAIGSVMLVVTSLMLIRTIDNAFNRIWRVNSQRPWMMQFLVYWALLTFGPFVFGRGLVGRDWSGASSGRIRMAEGYHYGFIYYGTTVGLIPLCAQPFRACQPCLGRRGRNGVLLGNGTLFIRLVHGQL